MQHEVDSNKQTVTSFISFIRIPVKEKARWQQVLPANAQLIACDTNGVLWDTSYRLLTVIWENFPQEDTVTYSFTAEFSPALPESFSWGQGAFLFVDKQNQIKKIQVFPRTIQYGLSSQDEVVLPEYMYYIQVGAGSNHRQSSFKLYQGDRIYKIKSKKYYLYHVGPYLTKAQAQKRLSFYQKQAPDAFIVKEKRKP